MKYFNETMLSRLIFSKYICFLVLASFLREVLSADNKNLNGESSPTSQAGSPLVNPLLAIKPIPPMEIEGTSESPKGKIVRTT